MTNRTTAVAWGAVAIALVAGLVIGYLLATFVIPLGKSVTFADLELEDKEKHVVLVAAGYAQDGDLEKAKARLDLLEVPNAAQLVAEVAQKYVQAGSEGQDTRSLAMLATAMGMANPTLVAYAATDTPVPTSTPPPTLTPTDTPSPTATETPTNTPEPPTDTPEPTPTDTPEPLPTDTPLPTPTDTPRPAPTNTPRPRPTNTPTSPPAPTWTWTARLVGIGEDAQRCESGLLQIRVTVLDPGGNQIPGVWVYDRYSGQYQVTGNVDSPDWGPGETKFEYGQHGGGSLCIASGEGGSCVSEYTRDMPCFNPPPFEDMWGAGYCQCCGAEYANNKELCRGLYDSGHVCMRWGHHSWRVVFRRTQ